MRMPASMMETVTVESEEGIFRGGGVCGDGKVEEEGAMMGDGFNGVGEGASSYRFFERATVGAARQFRLRLGSVNTYIAA